MTETHTTTIGERVPGRGRRIALKVVAVLTILAFIAMTPPDITHPVTGWLPDATYEEYVELFYGDETPADMASHRHHMLALSIMIWTLVVGVAAQLLRPESKQAPLWAAVSAVALVLILESVLLGFDPFTLFWVIPVLAVLALHPDRRQRGKVWPGASDGPYVLIAGVVAAIGLIYAVTQVRLQVNGLDVDPHVADGHYAYMAIGAVVWAIAVLAGASSLTGARITAWMAGIMGVLVGAFFIGFDDYASSPGVIWGAIGVVISLVYLVRVAMRPQTGDA